MAERIGDTGVFLSVRRIGTWVISGELRIIFLKKRPASYLSQAKNVETGRENVCVTLTENRPRAMAVDPYL